MRICFFQAREEIQRKAEQERLAKQRENARLKMERERRVSSNVLFSVFENRILNMIYSSM